MKAVLLILVPMLVLTGVMTAVFWAADDLGESVSPSRPVSPPSPEGEGAAADVAAPSAGRTRPDRRVRPDAGSARKSEPSGRTTGGLTTAAAEAVDDWVNLNRARLRRNRELQLKLARLALATRRPADAIAACDRILSSHPDDVDALSAKAEALVATERFDEAAAAYARAVKHRQDDLRLRYNHAVVLSRLKRFGEAVRHYEFILARRPDHARAMYNLAVILQDEGKLTDAAGMWEKVTRASPELAGAWFQRGVVALRLSDFETAATAFARADKLEPGRADTCANLGVAYHELGQLPEAIAAFQRAREAEPKYLPAVNGFAEVYVRFYEKHPDSEEHFECGLRWCEYSLSIRPDQAPLRALFGRLLKVRPDSVRVMNGLARVLAATPAERPLARSDHARALSLCRQSLAARPDQPEIAALLKRLEHRQQP